MRDRDYWVLLHSEQIGLTGGGMETRVTLRPGEKGTKALVAEHGDRLICVRSVTTPRRECATRPWNWWWSKYLGSLADATLIRSSGRGGHRVW